MPRYQHQQCAREPRRQRGVGVQQRLLLAGMRAARDPDGPRSDVSQPQLAALADARFCDLHVELDVADHMGSSAVRAEGDEALGILRTLRRDEGAGRHRGSEKRSETAVSGDRSWRQARIGEHHGHVSAPALVEQVGPQFGLHDEAQAWSNSRQEAAYRSRRIVGQEAHIDVVAEQRQRARPARRCRGGQDEGHRRMARAQLANQRCRCAHFAEGHRMQPEAHRCARGAARGRPPTEALEQTGPMAAIAQATAQRRQECRPAPNAR